MIFRLKWTKTPYLKCRAKSTLPCAKFWIFDPSIWYLYLWHSAVQLEWRSEAQVQVQGGDGCWWLAEDCGSLLYPVVTWTHLSLSSLCNCFESCACVRVRDVNVRCK
jgi:hypothetical protein